MNLIQVEGVSKYFGGIHALTDVDMDVRKGEIHGLIGPNGAGKTTLFNIISGNYHPSSGQIYFEGQDIASLRADERVGLGISRTFQNIRLFKTQTVLENVKIGFFSVTSVGWLRAIFTPFYTCKEERKLDWEAKEILKTLQLDAYAHEFAANLSYGDQRRLEIARALAARPSLLLLDEPAAGLNEAEVVVLARLIREIRQTGVTIIIVEHDMNLLMSISDNVTVLAHGQKIAEGKPLEIQKNETVIEEYLGKNYGKPNYEI